MTKYDAEAVKLGIRDGTQEVFILYQAGGLLACKRYDYQQAALREAVTAVEVAERDTYMLAYTTAAERVLSELPTWLYP